MRPTHIIASCYYECIITLLIMTQHLLYTVHATASCDNAPASQQCCPGQSDECKTQEVGVFCWCDEHCVANSDCCWDYYIICVTGVTMTLLNPYTGGGGERVDNIINSTSTHSLVITSELTTGAWSTITNVACQPFPTWLNIETTALSPVFGDTVSYICKTGYHFPDSAQYKDNSCDDNGDWVQEFYTCSANDSTSPEDVFSTPVEAPGAIYIGSSALIFMIIECSIVFISDCHHFVLAFRRCKRSHKRRNKKPKSDSKQANSDPESTNTEPDNPDLLTLPSTRYGTISTPSPYRSRRMCSVSDNSLKQHDYYHGNVSDGRTTVCDIIVDVDTENIIFV